MHICKYVSAYTNEAAKHKLCITPFDVKCIRGSV